MKQRRQSASFRDGEGSGREGWYSLVCPAQCHQVIHLPRTPGRAPHPLSSLQHGGHFTPLHPLGHENAHTLLKQKEKYLTSRHGRTRMQAVQFRVAGLGPLLQILESHVAAQVRGLGQ